MEPADVTPQQEPAPEQAQQARALSCALLLRASPRATRGMVLQLMRQARPRRR
jgi:hypothetical protein